MKNFLPLFVMLTACAPSEEKFESENISLVCEMTFECTAEEDIEAAKDIGLWFFGEDVEECKTILTEATSEAESDSGTTTDYVYDKQAAKECLAELGALTCEDMGDSGVTAPSCENVYTTAE